MSDDSKIARKTPRKKSPNRNDGAKTKVQPDSIQPFFVGIGASAGGLEALRELVGQLTVTGNTVFVITQHLSPAHPTLLAPLLQKECSMPVRMIEDGLIPETDVIYITPANANIVLSHGRLILTDPAPSGPKPSIDVFFASLASDIGDRAVGVILSGTGSDGAFGVRRIKAAGGFVFVQDDNTAKYPGMPRATRETGVVDREGAPGEIAHWLVQLPTLVHQIAVPLVSGNDEGHYPQILAMLHKHCGVDFSLYKESTLRRRLARRLAANQLHQLPGYIAFCAEHPDELDRLYRDFLISVTEFFRDKQVFEALSPIVGEIIQSKQANEEIRIWVPGCASGEEAYSLAILFAEALGPRVGQFKLQIFATDIDMEALARARRALFSAESLAGLPAEWIGRYFTLQDQHYQVNKTLRDLVIFARQDLISDPPFLRIDLVSCRNVLIYFKPGVHKKILEVFHYALNPSGYLLLGKSESVAQAENLFEPLQTRAKLFRSMPGARVPPRWRTWSGPAVRPGRPNGNDGQPHPSNQEILQRAAIATFVPACLLVDRGLNVLHVHGDLSRYLKLQPGVPSLQLSDWLPRALRNEVRALVAQAHNSRNVVRGRTLVAEPGMEPIQLGIYPIGNEAEECFIITFQSQENAVRESNGETGFTVEQEVLQEELAATRERLQTVIEELETSNEELQSLNEELQSSNEELQSTVEELETTNEELQATNEELSTVNQELQVKTFELTESNVDLENVKNSLDDPLVVLGRDLRVRLFNFAAQRALNLAYVQIGQDFDFHLIGSDARQRATLALNGEPCEPLQIRGERSYLLRFQSYMNVRGDIEGVLITFFDNTDLIEAQSRLRESEANLRAILSHAPLHAHMKDRSGKFVFINPAFRDAFALPEAIQGLSDWDLFEPDTARLFNERSQAVLESGQPSQTEEVLVLANGQKASFLSYRFPLQDQNGEINGVCRLALDITERLANEQRIRLQAEALNASSAGILIADAQGNDMPVIYANAASLKVTGYTHDEFVGKNCRFLQRDDIHQPPLIELRRALREGQLFHGLLRNYRKDGSMFWNELYVFPIRDHDHRITHFVGVQNDVTKRVQAEDALKANEARLRWAQEFARIGSFEFDPAVGRLTVTSVFAELLGLATTVREMPFEDFLKRLADADAIALESAAFATLRGEKTLAMDVQLTGSSIAAGRWLKIMANRTINEWNSLPVLVGLIQDITAQRLAEDQVRFLANHDPLTGLANRELLKERLGQALSFAQRTGKRVAVLFIDLDNFKNVNDTLGHRTGDALLRGVAGCIRGQIRESDTFSRMGGDEFVVIVPEVDDDRVPALVATKILGALRHPINLAGLEFQVGASIGICLYPDDGKDADELLANADRAMYHAKQEGRNHFQFFEPEMGVRAANRLSLESALRRALERDEFVLHYQPQFEYAENRVVGFEALIRWQRDGSLWLPSQFLPVALDCGLILDIDRWVLQSVCAQLTAWQAAGYELLPVAINTAPLHFENPALYQQLFSAVSGSGLIPWLEIEILENTLLRKPNEAKTALQTLADTGIRIAIDDFGSGFSSLSYLRDLPIHRLKIDHGFIRELDGDSRSRSIVSSIVSLGRCLGLEVLAEGVETPSQLTVLQGAECRLVQGFLFSQALASNELTHYLVKTESAKSSRSKSRQA